VHAPALNDLAERLSDRFDTRVKVDIGRNKGKITIEFATVDDLERIVSMIGVEEEGARSGGSDGTESSD
jgi:ParB family chromosome partitioning protein